MKRFAAGLAVFLLAASARAADRKWEVHLLHHTHVDIGFTEPQEDAKAKQWKNLDQALDLMDQSEGMPEPARFRWNPEVTWTVTTWYEQASPESRARFVRRVRDGSLGLDAMFANMLTGLCRPGELLEAFAGKRELERITQTSIDSAMITDVPGWTWGTVTALAESGVKYFSIGPNRTHRIGHTLSDWGDQPFYWASPSGRDKVLVFVHGKGYSWFHTPAMLTMEVSPQNKFTPARIFRYLKDLERQGYPYDIVPIRYAIGSDNGPPDPDISRIVAEWNEKFPDVQVRLSTASRTLAEFERRYGGQIPTFSGDFTPYWEDGAASTARETGEARNAAELLGQAQTLWALSDPASFPAADFRHVWEQVLLFNEHTWGAYNAITAPDSDFARTQWEWKRLRAEQAGEGAKALWDRAAAAMQAGMNGPNFAAVNTNSFPVTGPVTVSGPRPGDRVETAEGIAVPSQVLAGGGLLFIAEAVPGLAAKNFVLRPGTAEAGGGCEVSDYALSNDIIALTLDPDTGTIASLRGKIAGQEFVNARFPDRMNEYIYIRGRIPFLGRTRARGVPEFRVSEAGPVRCAIEITRPAPGSDRLITTVSVYQGLGRVDITNALDRPAVRAPEGIHFAFPVAADDPVVRYDVAWGTVEIDRDQMKGACKNYFTPLSWVDVSGADRGLQIVLVDAPLFEAGAIMTDAFWHGWKRKTRPNGAVYSYVMNNYWETNYKADQPGETSFRYSLFPHAGYDPAANARRGREVMQPLLPLRSDAGVTIPAPAIVLDNPNVVIEAVRPAPESGIEYDLVNLSGQDQATAITTAAACAVLENGRELQPIQSNRLAFGKHDLVRVVCK